MRRSVAVPGVALLACGVLLAVAFTTGAAAQETTQIDSCTVIDEPGEYELVADLDTDEDATCIDIRADGVTLHGNGHTITGPDSPAHTGGEWAGVRIDPDGTDGADIVVRNVQVESFKHGVHVADAGAVVVEDTEARANRRQGFNARDADVTVRNVTSTGNRGLGISGVDTITNAEVTDNHATGVSLRGDATLSDSLVANNGGDGVSPFGSAQRVPRIEDTVVRDNAGSAVDSHYERGPSTASGLVVGDAVTVAYTEEEIRIDGADRMDMPPRENATVAGEGVEVDSPLEDPDGTVELAFEIQTDDETVDLWRHDGSEWETVEEDLSVIDGTVETTVERNGTYVTGTDDPESDPSTIDSCRGITEPGEYEIVEDIRVDWTDNCIDVRADDVVIDGNGHVVEGPGADEDGVGIDVGGHSGLEVRNVEIAGWNRGVAADGSYELSNAVVRDNGHGLSHRAGGAETLSNVTVAHNDLGIYSMMGGASGTDVTVRDNGAGIFGIDGGNYDLESARIVDNERFGATVEHSSRLNLSGSMVSGNGGHGIHLPHYGFPVAAHVEDTTVSDNGGDGIRASGDSYDDVHLDGVTLHGNDGLELNAHPNGDSESDHPMAVTATDLAVGPSATTDFEELPLQLEPVDRDQLHDRDGGTAVGDGLTVGGNVSGPVDVELAVDTDDETVDLWRHDGSEWETVEEDLPVTDGTVEATVEEPGTFAPGTETEDSDDSQQDDTVDDDQDETDDDTVDDDQDTSEGTGSGSDGAGDDSQDDSDTDDVQQDDSDTVSDGDDQQDGPGGDDDSQDETDSENDGQQADPGSSDKDDEKTHTPMGTPTDEAEEETPTGTDPPGSTGGGADTKTKTDDDTAGTPTADESSSGTDDVYGGEATADEATDEDAVIGDGPGFTPVAALVALLGSALLLRRRA